MRFCHFRSDLDQLWAGLVNFGERSTTLFLPTTVLDVTVHRRITTYTCAITSSTDMSSEHGRFWANSTNDGQHWPLFRWLRPTLTKCSDPGKLRSCRTMADKLSKRCVGSPAATQIRPNSADVSHHSANFGQRLPNFSQTCQNLANNWPTSANIVAFLAKLD